MFNHTSTFETHEQGTSGVTSERIDVHMPSSRLLSLLQSLPPLVRYATGLGVIAIISVLLWVFQRHVGTINVALFYLVGVMICAVIGGRGPAIFSAFVSFLIFKYLFVTPIFTFRHRSNLLDSLSIRQQRLA